MKTYVITLSQVFPTWHKRAGEPTKFRAAFLKRHTGGTAELAVSCSEFIHFNTDKDHETERKRLDTSSR